MIIIFSSTDFVWAQNWRSRMFIKLKQSEQVLWFLDILLYKNNKFKKRLLICKYRSVRLTYSNGKFAIVRQICLAITYVSLWSFEVLRLKKESDMMIAVTWVSLTIAKRTKTQTLCKSLASIMQQPLHTFVYNRW